jgi:hypothetical protein
LIKSAGSVKSNPFPKENNPFKRIEIHGNLFDMLFAAAVLALIAGVWFLQGVERKR